MEDDEYEWELPEDNELDEDHIEWMWTQIR